MLLSNQGPHTHPAPRYVTDDAEQVLRDLVERPPSDGDPTYTVMRLVERAYGRGYDDGHLTGSRETRLSAELRASAAAAREAGDQQS